MDILFILKSKNQDYCSKDYKETNEEVYKTFLFYIILYTCFMYCTFMDEINVVYLNLIIISTIKLISR